MIRHVALMAFITLGITIQQCDAASAPLSATSEGHLSIPVMLNGQGPFDFTLDTAAQRPMVAPTVAVQLGIVSTSSSPIHGATGNGSVDIAELRDFRSGLFDRPQEAIAIVPPGGGVPTGVVGMDAFVDKRLELDFSRMIASESPSGVASPGFLPIQVAIVAATMIIADVTVNGVHAKALIDTGARRTIANASLQAALGFKINDPRFTAANAVGGATADKALANKAVLETIKLGDATFDRPLVTFANLPVFGPLGLADTPALILGLDQLKHLKAMAIDYPLSELQIKH